MHTHMCMCECVHVCRCSGSISSGKTPNAAFNDLALESIVTLNKKSSEEKMGPGAGTDIG